MQKTVRIAKRTARYAAAGAFSTAMFLGTVVSGFGFAGTVAGPDTTTLELDRDGADVFPAGEHASANGLDLTVLYLDREGADSPTGYWWNTSSYAAAQPAAIPPVYKGPDITGLNLDRDGADRVID
jgi:hypothetical protein